MRLHAILGQSRLHLASAIIAVDWEKISLYGSDQKQFQDIKRGLISLIKSHPELSEIPAHALSKKTEFIKIPTLDRRNNDMLSMIRELRKSLKVMREEIDSSDVLFSSGTKPHLSLFVSERGFERILSFRDDSLELQINTKEKGETKISRLPPIPVPAWNIKSVLIVHGIEEDNGWIITPFVESKGYSEKRTAPYSIELDEISSSKILLLWETPKNAGDRKRLTELVIDYNKILAGSIIHEVEDEVLSNWCRNTHLPPPVNEPMDSETPISETSEEE